MAASFKAAHARVCALVHDFDRHKDYYLSPDYSEASARKDFIDKLFNALGWDVDHNVQKNPFEQEVAIERTVSDEKLNKRRADYAFAIAPRYRKYNAIGE
jgi:type I site-specific restriction endonuclease